MRRLIAALGASLALAPASGALAQADTRAAVAEALYRQARDLMAAEKYDEACPKFAESQRLDPATGTLLNLAACHERQGKLASAWTEYSDAMAAARRDQREDRVEYARQRMLELEPKLSHLTLTLQPAADHPGLTLELDDAALGVAVIGAAMPIDPGPHTIVAKAPGKKPWSQRIEIGAVADSRMLSIPPLEDAPAEPVAPAPVVVAPAPSLTEPRRDELTTRPVPTSVYLTGGITLALAAGAGVTGVAYLQKKETYEQAVDDGASDAAGFRKTARNYGYVNLGLWAATAVGAGVTTYLYLARPEERVSTARGLPWASPDGAGLALTGGF